MKKIISTALAAVAALSLAGCSKKDGGDTVKVGILHSLSGTIKSRILGKKNWCNLRTYFYQASIIKVGKLRTKREFEF